MWIFIVSKVYFSFCVSVECQCAVKVLFTCLDAHLSQHSKLSRKKNESNLLCKKYPRSWLGKGAHTASPFILFDNITVCEIYCTLCLHPRANHIHATILTKLWAVDDVWTLNSMGFYHFCLALMVCEKRELECFPLQSRKNKLNTTQKPLVRNFEQHILNSQSLVSGSKPGIAENTMP